MAVKNILKDGTVVDDMSKVTVPKEIVKAMVAIANVRKKERCDTNEG